MNEVYSPPETEASVTTLLVNLLQTLEVRYPDPPYVATLKAIYTKVEEYQANSGPLDISATDAKYLIQNIFNRYKLFELLLSFTPTTINDLYYSSNHVRYFAATKGIKIFEEKDSDGDSITYYYATYQDFNVPLTMKEAAACQLEPNFYEVTFDANGNIESSELSEYKEPQDDWVSVFNWLGNGHVLPSAEQTKILINPDNQYISIFVENKAETPVLQNVNIYEKNWGVDIIQSQPGLTFISSKNNGNESSNFKFKGASLNISKYTDQDFSNVCVELLTFKQENIEVILELPLMMPSQDMLTHITIKDDPSFNILITGCT